MKTYYSLEISSYSGANQPSTFSSASKIVLQPLVAGKGVSPSTHPLNHQTLVFQSFSKKTLSVGVTHRTLAKSFSLALSPKMLTYHSPKTVGYEP